jgi:hypothetical protein
MVSSITPPMSAQEPPAHLLAPSKQAMTFCRTTDGINLAIATVGRGPALVHAAHWAGRADGIE